jgi:hypothetical protein
MTIIGVVRLLFDRLVKCYAHQGQIGEKFSVSLRMIHATLFHN